MLSSISATERAFARYPIFWGLHNIGSLPNPDPTDTGDWDKRLLDNCSINVDPAIEGERGNLR